MANRTPFYDWHQANRGRMIDFGGWDMPVQYTSIIDEHRAVRTAAGLFDISHMGRLELHGPDALALIQYVFTNDASTMTVGQVRYGLLTNDHGGVKDDVLVYRRPDRWGMVVNSSNREKIVGWLSGHARGRQVSLEDHTAATAMIAVQGPTAADLCRGLTADEFAAGEQRLPYYFARETRYRDSACVVSRTGYTGEDGFEIVVPADRGVQLWEDLVARGARPCGLGARDTLRLEAGMPLYGHELSETIDPYQAGLGWAVKPEKGEFVGRASLLAARDNPARRRRAGLGLGGKRPARDGSVILDGGQEIGTVTSGSFAPTLGTAVAMGYLDPAYATPGTALTVAVRGTREPARVVPLPFYRRRQA